MNTLSKLAKKIIELADETAMVAFGQAISALIKNPMVITLQGQLGAGKTTLSRGILQGLGHCGSVKSPTYTLVEPYRLPAGQVFHFDLYRIVDAEELEYMGIRDFQNGADILLIEWPDRGQGFLPKPDLVVRIRYLKPGRQLQVSAESARGRAFLAQFSG